MTDNSLRPGSLLPPDLLSSGLQYSSSPTASGLTTAVSRALGALKEALEKTQRMRREKPPGAPPAEVLDRMESEIVQAIRLMQPNLNEIETSLGKLKTAIEALR